MLEPPQLPLPDRPPTTIKKEVPVLRAGSSCFWIVLIGFAIFWSSIGLGEHDVDALLPIILIFLTAIPAGFAGLAAYANKMNKQAYEAEQKKYQAECAALNQPQNEKRRVYDTAMQRWGDLFYCHRCDHVFIPATNQAARAEKMNDLLMHGF